MIQFAAPTRIVAGLGCVRDRLAGELCALGGLRVAVIADRGFAEAGLLEPVLSAAGVETACALVGEDPDVAEAERASLAALQDGAEAILGGGGGSALCAAKAAAIRLHNPPPLNAYTGDGRLPRPPAPVVAVPTTGGSGTEVSNVVVLHDPALPRHLVIRGRGYKPRVAMLDGALLRTLPRRPLVAAALDALSHALEALWVRGASRITDALAASAAATIPEQLPRALEDGGDDARQALLEASAIANLACGNSGLGLVHALSSATSVHLPHGYQNGVLLPHVAAYNRPAVREVAAAAIDRLDGLYERIGFAARFAPASWGRGTRRPWCKPRWTTPLPPTTAARPTRTPWPASWLPRSISPPGGLAVSRNLSTRFERLLNSQRCYPHQAAMEWPGGRPPIRRQGSSRRRLRP